MASEKQIKEHIEIFAPIIQKYAKQYGYSVCSPIIAQSITETVSSKDPSGWSVLKYKYNNFFGLKCGKYWKGKSVNLKTGEYYSGNYTIIKDNFRVFDDIESGIQGYFVFTSTSRYAKLKSKETNTPQKYLEELQKSGYATSPVYIQNNLALIKKYNLDRYDDFTEVTKDPISDTKQDTKLPILKLGMNDKDLGAPYIASWQTYLNTCGYELPITGVFDNNTFSVVIKYQKCHGLVCDGIIGAKTWASVPKP